MGDTCFGCKNECKRYLKFLDIPKKVDLCRVDMSTRKPLDMPLCKICFQKIDGKKWKSLESVLSYLQEKKIPYSIPLTIRPKILWDPDRYYKNIQEQQRMFLEGTTFEVFIDYNSLYPSIMLPYQLYSKE